MDRSNPIQAINSFILAAFLGLTAVSPGRSEDKPALPNGAVARLGSSEFRFPGEPGGSVVFSADGKLLACAHSRGAAVFDTVTGREIHRLKLPKGQYATCLRLLDDGKRIAIGSAGEGTTKVTTYHLSDGKLEASADFQGQQAATVCDITADGGRALLVRYIQWAVLWDIKSAKKVWSCELAGGTFVLPFTPDEKRFAVADYPQPELRDATNGKLIAKFPDAGREFRYEWGALSPDGQKLAAISYKGDTVAVLDLKSTAPVRTLPSNQSSHRLTFSPDSRYLVGFDKWGTQIWDLSAGDKGPVARLPPSISVGFTRDGKTLALVREGSITLWSVGDWKPRLQLENPPSCAYQVRVSDDGKRVFGYTLHGWVSWPLLGGTQTNSHAEGIQGVRASAEGTWATISGDGRIAIEISQVLGKPGERPKIATWVTDAQTRKTRDISAFFAIHPPHLSADGKFLTLIDPGREAIVLDALSGAVLFRQKPERGEFFYGAFPASDGRSLRWSVAAALANNNSGPGFTRAMITDHKTKRSWKMDPMPWSIRRDARSSRDGNLFLTRSRFDDVLSTDSVCLWDVQTGRRIAMWTGNYGEMGAIALSADARSMLHGDRDGTFVVIEAATSKERVRFEHGCRLLSLDFTPNGSHVVSSGEDASVFVWDLIGPPVQWDQTKADNIWADLASTEAKTAYSAMRRLRASPNEGVKFLKERMTLAKPPSDESVDKWIKDLDAKAFPARERAQRSLTEVAEQIRPKLEAARKGASEEAKNRLDSAIKSTEGWNGERLRRLRACETLEGMATENAIEVLKSWSAGLPAHG